MIKLKDLLAEQEERIGATNQEYKSYNITYMDNTVRRETLDWLNDIYDLKTPADVLRNGTLTSKGVQQFIDFTKENETLPGEQIKSIVPYDPNLSNNEEKAWKYYIDYGMDEAELEKLNWDKQSAIDYNLKVWEPLRYLGDKIEKFWSSVTVKGSESYKLFQPYNQFWDDKQYLARNEWWKQVGSKEYQTARRIQNEEDKIWRKKDKRNAYKFMYALFDDKDDSIYQEIAETINNEVIWSIKHPLTNETFEFRADPEFDDW